MFQRFICVYADGEMVHGEMVEYNRKSEFYKKVGMIVRDNKKDYPKKTIHYKAQKEMRVVE